MCKLPKLLTLCLLATPIFMVACHPKDAATRVKVDGSNTVYPIAEAVAEEFQKGREVQVTIGAGGTGSGFSKFCRGELNITNASRPIKESEEALCKQNKIDFIEIPIAYDGIVVVVNPKSQWIKNITTDELKRIFEPSAQGKIMKWNQINPSWPDAPIHLFSAAIDSGTFDYFTGAIIGKEKASRGDVTSSQDYNVLVQGVSTDVNALGYFGLAYYYENKEKLKAVSVNDILPSKETILNRSYAPLSRPLFIYLATNEENKGASYDLAEFFLGQGQPLVDKVGYVALQESVLAMVKSRLSQRKKGTLFNKENASSTLESVLKNAK